MFNNPITLKAAIIGQVVTCSTWISNMKLNALTNASNILPVFIFIVLIVSFLLLHIAQWDEINRKDKNIYNTFLKVFPIDEKCVVCKT